MNTILSYFFILFMISCSASPYMAAYPEPDPEPEEKPPIDFENMEDGEKIPIQYTEDGGKIILKDYKATKIGEYLWMDSNFNYPVESGHGVTQHQINKCLDIYRIDTTKYTVTPEQFNKYFGHYYSRARIEYMEGAGYMFEGSNRLDNGKWGMPTAAAFRQLWAMCGDASERAVRTALCYRIGEIPIMKHVTNGFWIESANTNKYGFNLVYSGGRCHNNDFPWGTCHGPGDCYQFYGKKGDLYTFYGAVMYPAAGSVTAKLHDFPDTRDGKIWAWLPLRWCRRLTPVELGYELYVDKARSDIKKLKLGVKPPAGYEVLPDGYLRGFYVQFILDKANPIFTVSQLRTMEKNLEEVKRGTPLT